MTNSKPTYLTFSAVRTYQDEKNGDSQIPDPETFFEELGEQIADQIDELSFSLAGDDPPGESCLDKLGRLNMARQNAESEVLKEMALLAPESESPAS